MRTFTLACLMLSTAFLGGCPPKSAQPAPGEVFSQAAHDGLSLELRVPREHLLRGEVVAVTVTARNLTRSDMVIPARSGALVYLTLWHKTFAGWEEVMRYPETDAQVLSPWRLAARAAHTFPPLELRVGPDWPSGEPLRITAELNGRPEPRAAGIVRVHLTQEQRDQAAKAP